MLKGYRTYIIGWLMVVSVIVQFLVGDLSVWDLMRQLPEIFNGLGIITLRAGIAAHFRGLASATDQPVPHVKGGTSTEWLTRPTGADRSAPDSSDDPT